MAEQVALSEKLQTRLGITRNALAAFCRRWQIAELAVFGSALRDDFRPDSDLDLLVTFAPTADWSLLDHIQMEQEFAKLAGRKVDLLTRRAIERSHNSIRRQSILDSATPVYVAG